jgi:anti-sigma B factor antagonist
LLLWCSNFSPHKLGYFLVTTDCPIFTGIFNGFSWIRCEGKGSFQNSPAMKEFGDARIAAGEKCLVVDLEACTGMDSTFMGSLAGLASRLTSLNQGVLQVANPGPRNQRSLEDLGLDFLMEIDPPEPIWGAQAETVRTTLRAPHGLTQPEQLQRARHVLEAHQQLSSLSVDNAKKFSTVVSLLESELEEKQKLAETPDPR